MKSRPATPESENPVDDKVNEASLEQATEETVVPIAVAQDGGAEPEFIDYDESANSNNKEKEKEKEKEKIEVQVEKSVAADTGALEDSRYQEMHDEKDVEINLDRAQISSIRRAQSLVDSLRWLNPVQYVIGPLSAAGFNTLIAPMLPDVLKLPLGFAVGAFASRMTRHALDVTPNVNFVEKTVVQGVTTAGLSTTYDAVVSAMSHTPSKAELALVEGVAAGLVQKAAEKVYGRSKPGVTACASSMFSRVKAACARRAVVSDQEALLAQESVNSVNLTH